jgi:hypothetical protein
MNTTVHHRRFGPTPDFRSALKQAGWSLPRMVCLIILSLSSSTASPGNPWWLLRSMGRIP